MVLRAACILTGEQPVSLAVMMLLRLLITWAHDCQPALAALLAPPGHLPMLLELAQKRYLPCSSCSYFQSCPKKLSCMQQPPALSRLPIKFTQYTQNSTLLFSTSTGSEI